MKLIKLDKRYKLHTHYGFKYAFWFDTYRFETTKVEDFFKKTFGFSWQGYGPGRWQWSTHWCRRDKESGTSPYMIGFMDPSVISLLLLTTEIQLEISENLTSDHIFGPNS